MVRWLEHLYYEERRRAFGLFSLKNRRLHRGPIEAFQYLKRTTRELERDFLHLHRTWGNGFILKNSNLDIRKKFFTVKMVRLQYRLPREGGNAQSLDIFKARLDGALSNLV
ncbi:hypothetical protein WISP_26497 [Willisornis vidua]|uniref:Uncharacterized protein n=1 Tax=Willisornis vidua TaxID=1566151 RepID=A0ABQ9DLG2_9PASS|nr:hypothetical protein WISP_26497 [Willisornis vidua]